VLEIALPLIRLRCTGPGGAGHAESEQRHEGDSDAELIHDITS
jgi:hypothetical protein